MNVIRALAVGMFISACSDTADVERRAAAPPAPGDVPAPTTGVEPPPPPLVERAARAETIEAKDARAAAKGPVAQAAVQAGVNPDAAVLHDFTMRVEDYMQIHRSAAKGSAKPKETADPAEINKTEDTLAARIAASRPAAKHGDIFTTEIRTKFRRLLAPELKGEDGRDAKALMKDDAPAPGSIPFKVNATYPDNQPRPTVPANVLLNLPTLPTPLEYRFIGRHLVLVDTAAGLIVDYIPNAIS